MAELIQTWLNNEIELSKPIENFEDDFANGYLFGELLFKFNQQSNFKEFSRKDIVAAKLDNFSKLEPTLRNLKIKFDSRMIDDIIKGKRGVSLRLLYQIKMALEKVYPPTDIAVLKKSNITGKMGDNQPALKIAHSKEKYDSHAHKFFQERLQTLNKPQKQLNEEKHLQKFENERQRQENLAETYKFELQEAREKAKQEIRKAQINKLQRNAGFMEEWMQKGAEDWKKNQMIKKERERRDLEFEYKQTEKLSSMTMNLINNANKEVHDGIYQFEQNLERHGIHTKIKKEDAEKAVTEHLSNSPLKGTQRLSKFNQSVSSTHRQRFQSQMQPQLMMGAMMTATGGITLTSTGLRTKDRKTVNEKTKKERERRRRKLIVEQSKLLSEMDQKRREINIQDRMKRQSKQEVELQYESFRTGQCKNIIIDNRQLREVRYMKRKELDLQTSNWREEEMLHYMKDNMDRELDILEHRDQEIRIVQKQFKREQRTDVGQILFDQIFEIANQAYIHQQLNDTENIDDRCWHDWLQLFKDDIPVGKSEPEKIDQTLNESELVDYLKNQGQWKKELIEEYKVNLEAILTGQTEQQNAPKGKGAPAKANQEQLQLEEGDTELVLDTNNNHILGNVVQQIININFEPRMKIKRPKVPFYVGFKMCFIGYPFTGKSTVALNLKEHFYNQLEVFFMEDLINEAMVFSENNPEPIVLSRPQSIQQQREESEKNNEQEEEKQVEQENQVEKEEEKQDEQEYQDIEKKEDEEQKEQVENEEAQQKNEQVEEEKPKEKNYNLNPYEDFRLGGQMIKECLLSGEDIPDEVYIQIFIAKLRIKFPYKSKQSIKDERELIVKRQREIQLEIARLEQENLIDSEKKNKKSQIEQREEQIKELQKEMEIILEREKLGWVLVDFPSNFAQAKLLETSLSGYMPTLEQEINQREKFLQDSHLLAKPDQELAVEEKLINSGMDNIVEFSDITRRECLRRAIGRRYDPQNEKVFHIEDNPPQTTSAPLCERLIPIYEKPQQDQTEETNLENLCERKGEEQVLIDRFMAFDNEIQSMRRWWKNFGIHELERPIWKKVNASDEQVHVEESLCLIVEEILNIKFKEDDEKRQKIMDRILEEEQVQWNEYQEKKRKEEEEAERQRLIDEGDEEAIAQQKQIDEQKEQERLAEERKNMKPESVEKIPQKIAALENIDDDIKGKLINLWSQCSQNYKERMMNIFQQLRVQREDVINQWAQIQDTFLKFLHRPDTKQEKLDQFIIDFNQFTDDYPDLREDDQTKEELHQRTDILTDEMWEILEERRDQEIEERKKIMENGFVEHQLQFLVNCVEQAMQGEVDRFRSCVQLIQDYYNLIEDKLITEKQAVITVDIVQEGNDDLGQVETFQEGQDIYNIDNYNYPRLDKLFEKALKLQVIVDTVQQADKKGAPPQKKGADPKKQAQQEEEKQEESEYMKEMKQGVKLEKQILRYRLVLLRNWALKQLKEMRKKALVVYQKLDDWILVSKKAEMSAVDEMAKVIKQAIEEETKIQDELRIKFIDFSVDQKIMNFIVPPPEKLPQMEELRNNRFSIKQLEKLIQEIFQLSKGEKQIKNEILVEYFVRKLEVGNFLKDDSSLIKDWAEFGEYDFQIMVRNLDRFSSGYINWKQLLIYLILIQSDIPSHQQIDQYTQALKHKVNGQNSIEKEEFLQVNAWFDKTEYSEDRVYSIPFPRVRLIKEFIFDILKEQDKDGEKQVIQIKKLVNTLSAKEIVYLSKQKLTKYNDLLFTPVESKQ